LRAAAAGAVAAVVARWATALLLVCVPAAPAAATLFSTCCVVFSCAAAGIDMLLGMSRTQRASSPHNDSARAPPNERERRAQTTRITKKAPNEAVAGRARHSITHYGHDQSFSSTRRPEQARFAERGQCQKIPLRPHHLVPEDSGASILAVMQLYIGFEKLYERTGQGNLKDRWRERWWFVVVVWCSLC
jgi:hypothetical protein